MQLDFSHESADIGTSPDYSRLGTAEERRAYYTDNGYLVRRGLLHLELCERAVTSFRSEIKPYSGYLYRQASANPEKNRFDSAGNMLNPLLNPISVSSRQFPLFRAASDCILADERLFAAVEELLGHDPVLVQSMLFEANPATWPHQDCYYLDSERPGELLGAWIALEDIAQEAGRFYIVPGSHRMHIGENRGPLNIGRYHERYKRTVHDAIRDRSLEMRAPAMRRGDVLFWNSRTIHGAFEPSESGRTRTSYTAHFVPCSPILMQYQCIPVPLRPERIGRHAVCRPKNQDRRSNRCRLAVEIAVPRTFQFVKRKSIAWKISRLNP